MMMARTASVLWANLVLKCWDAVLMKIKANLTTEGQDGNVKCCYFPLGGASTNIIGHKNSIEVEACSP